MYLTPSLVALYHFLGTFRHSYIGWQLRSKSWRIGEMEPRTVAIRKFSLQEQINDIFTANKAFPKIDQAFLESKPNKFSYFLVPQTDSYSLSPVFVLICSFVLAWQSAHLRFFSLAGFHSYLTFCSRDLLGKLIVFELVKDFSYVNEIRASYRVKMSPTLVPVSQMNPVHIVTSCISVTHVLLLPSRVQLCLEINLFSSGLPSKILCAFLLAALRHTPLIHLGSFLSPPSVILTKLVHPLVLIYNFVYFP